MWVRAKKLKWYVKLRGDPPGHNWLWPCLQMRKEEIVCSLDGGGTKLSSANLESQFPAQSVTQAATYPRLIMLMSRYRRVKEKVGCSLLIAIHRDPYHERFPFLATCDDDKALRLNCNTCFLYMFLNVPAKYKCMQVTSCKAQLMLQLPKSLKTHIIMSLFLEFTELKFNFIYIYIYI